MAGRTSFGQITDTDFSELLAALSANPKGRAFLEEYRRRSRPDEVLSLLDALHRIEATIGGIRDQLQPRRIADELERVAMTLEIAMDGMAADSEGDEPARRWALIARARRELAMLARSLAHPVPPHPVAASDGTVAASTAVRRAEIGLVERYRSLLDQFGDSIPVPADER